MTNIYCCNCQVEVAANLVWGKTIYPKREDLYHLPFWQCKCGNYVGTHYKSDTPMKPLGNIPTQEIRRARMHIHDLLDPLWNKHKKKWRRNLIYKIISDCIGREYHTGQIQSIDEARHVYKIILKIKSGIDTFGSENFLTKSPQKIKDIIFP